MSKANCLCSVDSWCNINECPYNLNDIFPNGDIHVYPYGNTYLIVSYLNICFQGKAWLDEVRKCLMKAIAPLYKGAHDCDTIKRIAFDSHVDCYIKSGVGFCKMAADTSNWDALWAVYEMKDFAGRDYAAAWKQVTATIHMHA